MWPRRVAGSILSNAERSNKEIKAERSNRIRAEAHRLNNEDFISFCVGELSLWNGTACKVAGTLCQDHLY